MSNQMKKELYPIILALVSIPYLLLLLNLVHSFLGYQSFLSDYAPSLDFENQHYLGFWIWLFLIPYAVLFFFRDNEIGDIPLELVICGSGAIALLGPFAQSYDWSYVFALILLISAGMLGLYWKGIERKKTDSGPY